MKLFSSLFSFFSNSADKQKEPSEEEIKKKETEEWYEKTYTNQEYKGYNRPKPKSFLDDDNVSISVK